MVSLYCSCRTLVAGHAAEINATNELSMFVSLAQLRLLNVLAVEALQDLSVVIDKMERSHPDTIVQDNGIEKSSSTLLPPVADASSSTLPPPPQISGGKAAPAKPSRRSHQDLVPLEILLTGSGVSIALFKLQEEEVSEDEGEERDRVRLVPLLHSRISQPHLYLVISRESRVSTAMRGEKINLLLIMHCVLILQKVDISCFDASVRLPSFKNAKPILCPAGRRLPEWQVDFPSRWFQTRPGEPDPKSGVPPALLTCTVAQQPGGSPVLKAAVERPVKIDLGTEFTAALSEAAKEAAEAVDLEGMVEKALPRRESPDHIGEGPGPTGDALSEWEGFVRRMHPLSSVTVDTAQLVCQYAISEEGSSSEPPSVVVTAGVMGISAGVKLAREGRKRANAAEATLALDR